MADLREAAQQALEALEDARHHMSAAGAFTEPQLAAQDALRAALAQPALQPLTFSQVCELMPPDFGWDDPCTPALVRHIIEAAHGITAAPTTDKGQG